MVKLTKYGEEVEVALPGKKAGPNQFDADPDLQAAVGKLKEGDVVLVDVKPGRPPENQAKRSLSRSIMSSSGAAATPGGRNPSNSIYPPRP